MNGLSGDPVLGRFLSIDPVNFSPDKPFMFGRYTYVGNDPIGAWDPEGEECVNSGDGTTNCVTDDYNVTFPTPEGFQNTDSSASDYHQYQTDAQSPLGPDATRDWVRNNPTPGNPSPATPEGTVNDATPIIGGLPGNISPVTSNTTVNQVTGQEVVVNATLPQHPLGNGIVVREVTPNADGTSTIRNYGEGNGRLQAPGSPVAGPINNIWREQRPPGPALPAMQRPDFCQSCL